MNSTPKPELTALGFATGIMFGLASLGIEEHNPTTYASHKAASTAFANLSEGELDIRFLIILGDHGSRDWDDALREFRHDYGLSWGSDGTIYLSKVHPEVIQKTLENLPLGVGFWQNLARVYLEALRTR